LPITPAEDLKYWLALLRSPRIGPVSFSKLLQQFDQLEQVFSSPANQLRMCGLETASIDAILNPDWQGVDTDLEWLQQQDHHYIVTLRDPGYPQMLRESPAAPPLLFVMGHPQILNETQIAMVGSRNPTADGKQTALEFARHLSAAGLVITSGLAIGIDGICHQGALDADGITIAVTGTGLDRIYPARNRDLAHAITDKGAIISEFPIGTPARPENFPRRNRIISALSIGTLVVEAAIRSGSLITARHAMEQGREVFAIPGSIHNPLARGCHHLIQQGAKLVETAEDILSELWLQRPVAEDALQALNYKEEIEAVEDPDYQTVLTEMGFSPVPVDEIVLRTGLTAEEVSSMMLILELQGNVASSPGGCYIRVK
jgi:DNA processing protein